MNYKENLIKSNDEIIKLIKLNKPFSVIRLGIGGETYITYEYNLTNNINEKFLHPIHKTLYNAGIYSNNKNIKVIELFIKFYEKSIMNSDILACFDNCNINLIQNYYLKKYNLTKCISRVLEPFYQINENIIPWTHYLINKKILIINPFVESFKKQIKNNFTIFKNKKLFLDNQEFIFYKSFQTIAGNHIHNNWFKTFTIMCNDISKIEFDIALLGCGGYGLPLCNYIKTKLNKSAIYIGGGIQLLFGVTGKRWENNQMWINIIKNNDTKFIRPSNDEICKNLKTIENGCYW